MGEKVLTRICPDKAFIYHVMTTIFALTGDDGTDPMKFNPSADEFYVELYTETKRIGLFRLKIWNSTTIQVCINILPEYRREFANSGTEAFYDYLRENLKGTHKLISFVPRCFPHVLRHAMKHGWSIEGESKEGFLRNGKFYDVAQIGILFSDIMEM